MDMQLHAFTLTHHVYTSQTHHPHPHHSLPTGPPRREQTLTHGVSLTPVVTSGVGRLAGPPEKRLYQALLPELML